MSTWTYIHSEPGWTNEHGQYIPGLWTVVLTDTDDTWHPESDHDNPDAAAARVHWLNGGAPAGICGARLSDSDPRFGTRLYVCTGIPGHAREHYDGVADAPAGRWTDHD